MSNAKGYLGFIAGALVGAAIGAVAGLLAAPRSGAETRTMVEEAATDAWGNVVDAYEQGAKTVSERVSEFRPTVDAATDELREKVDQARAHMDELRSSLSQNAQHVADVIISVDEDATVEPAEGGAQAAAADQPDADQPA